MPNRMFSWLTGVCLSLSIGTYSQAQERIVSTDAATTQIVFALQIDAALVGVDVTSSMPPGYRELANVGYHRALSAEGLLALDPSLVIGSEHLGPPIVQASLAAAGIPVLQLPAANTLAELQHNINSVAATTGSQGQAQAVMDQLAALGDQLASSALLGERILFVLAVEPGKLRIAGDNTSGNAFIKLLGAQNIADFDAYRTLSAEAVLELNPSIILVASRDGATPSQLLELNPILQYSDAARRGHIAEVNATNLVAGLSPGAIAEAAILAAIIRREMATN